MFCEAQVLGVHAVVPHLFAPPAPQVCPALQSPQKSAPPQPSPTMPQLAPSAAQLEGTQPESGTELGVQLTAKTTRGRVHSQQERKVH